MMSFEEQPSKSPPRAFAIPIPKINQSEIAPDNVKSNFIDSIRLDQTANEQIETTQIGEKKKEDVDMTNILGSADKLENQSTENSAVELSSNENEDERVFKSLKMRTTFDTFLDKSSISFPKMDGKSEEPFDESEFPEKPIQSPQGMKASNQFIDTELEDGEVIGNDENDLTEPTFGGSPKICRFFLSKTCTWGTKCRFEHPTTNTYGNYVMFEKKELPVSASKTRTPEAWPMQPSDGLTDLESPFDRDFRSVKQMMQNAGYLPPLKIRKHPAPPAMVTFSFNDSAPYYPQLQPCSSVERVALLPTPTSDTIPKIKGPHTSTPYVERAQVSTTQHESCDDDRRICSDPWMTAKSGTPKRISRRIGNRSSRSSSMSSSSSESSSEVQTSHRSKESIGKGRSSNPKRITAGTVRNRFRGPRTPSLSPPRKLKRNITNSPQKRRLLSNSSSSCIDSPTTSFDSTSNSSSSKDSDKHRRKNPNKRTPSRKSPSVTTSRDRCSKSNSKKSRQEYLLMKLLVVEEQIAKKKRSK